VVDVKKNFISPLPELVLKTVEFYKTQNKTLPETIIVYRMGQGES
jgi:hypothetical protein